MIISPIGGVRLPARIQSMRKQAKLQAAGTRVYLLLPPDNRFTLYLHEGDPVKAGTLIASDADGLPIFSSVSGTFDGVFSNHGKDYAGVTDDGKDETAAIRAPESRLITDITAGELLEAAGVLGIQDIRSGERLYRTASRAFGKVRRVIIDVTDPGGSGMTNYATAMQSPSDLICGAKLIAKLVGAARAVLLTDADLPQTARLLKEKCGKTPFFALAKVGVCYPMTDEMIYEMLYRERIPRGSSLLEKGVFLTDAQTAVQFYSAMLTGIPQTTRTITASGEGFGQQASLQVPLGTPWQNILAACEFREGEYRTMINNPVCGAPAVGVCEGNAASVFSGKEQETVASPCKACGRCALACPVWLQPQKILFTGSVSEKQRLVMDCIGCGCCDYVCPAGLPLRSMITEYRKHPEEVESDA